MIDISIILAVHREKNFVLKTLCSLERAAAHAQLNGLLVELVISLDRPDGETEAIVRGFNSGYFSNIVIQLVDNGSLGPTRNDGISASSGRFIATADADDLIDREFLTRHHRKAVQTSSPTLLFPEFIIGFGSSNYIGHYESWRTNQALALIENHVFISRVFGRREIFEAVPYIDLRSSGSYAFEDWHFNSQCLSKGYNLDIVPDTILFYRQRTGSLSDSAKNSSTRQIPASNLFGASNFQGVNARLANPALGQHRRVERKSDVEIRNHSILFDAIIDIYDLEPQVETWQYDSAPIYRNYQDINFRIGNAYLELCRIIDDTTISDVFLLPDFSPGGSLRVQMDIAKAMYDLGHNGLIVALAGECMRGSGFAKITPPNVLCLTLRDLFPNLDRNEILLLTLRIIQNLAPLSRIHIQQCLYAYDFVKLYGRALSQKFILHRYCDEVFLWRGRWIVSQTFAEFWRKHHSIIDHVITDCQTIITLDAAKLDGYRTKAVCLRARQDVMRSPSSPSLTISTGGCRILWVSRVAAQKRPELLADIITSVRRTVPNAELDIFGPIDNKISADVIDIWRDCAGLKFKGEVAKFEDVEPENYDIFIYTSRFDGFPNVVLEAIAYGLPVVASNVGGISEIVIDGVSGFLVDESSKESCTEAFTSCILRLLRDPSLRLRMAASAQSRLLENSSIFHRQNVKQIFSNMMGDRP